jgi:pimeloyl-ACP methyl ester carboxylesterase
MNLTTSNHSGKSHRRTVVHHFMVAMVFVLVASMVTADPIGAESGQSSQSTPTPLFGVGIARCTFVDQSRSALNYSTTPYRVMAGGRRLVTEIRYPIQRRSGEPPESAGATAIPRHGGYPMVVFAHGYDSTPDRYAALLDAWVRSGFVVVAPIFPDENAAEVVAQHGTNTEGDLANEPGDITFVTKSVLDASLGESTGCHIVNGLVDSSEVALAGHSDGAEAVGMLAYDHGDDPQGVNYASLRSHLSYKAVIILSGAEDTSQSYATEASRPDLLVVQSLADQCNPMRFGVQLYDGIHQSNKWFLELQTAHHLPPFDGVDRSAFGVVTTTTIAFLRMSLEGVSPSIGLAALGSRRPSIARMFFGSPGPSMKNVVPVSESCGPN